jgi:rod shape determining protein RodA
MSHHWLGPKGYSFGRRFHLDLPLLWGLFLLISLAFVILYSASQAEVAVLERQGLRCLLSFAVLFIMANIHPRSYRTWSPALFAISFLLLVAVLIFGDVSKGAQRWLNFGFFRFQPAELMKLALPLMLATYLGDQQLPIRIKKLTICLLLLLIPVLLVAKQPDLGTALLIFSSGLITIFLSGISWYYLGAAFFITAFSAPLLWFNLHDYQRQRVLTFLDPESDPLGSGYHIIQSKIALGSGGLVGKGWLNGTQSHLEFLPERTTDFIFAVFGEEFGLLGALLLLAIYAFILIRSFVMSLQMEDSFGRLLAGTLSFTFFVYFFVNIGMVSGILPVVGVPLPLVSYGGTSLVTLMAGFGVLMSLHTHRHLLAR